jgi:hypothetical protein
MRKLILVIFALSSLGAFANPGERTMKAAIKCATEMLYNHQGSDDNLIGVVKMLKKVQTYLSSEHPSQTVPLGPIEEDLYRCNQLKGVRAYFRPDLFSVIDNRVEMSYHLRTFVRNLVTNKKSYKSSADMNLLLALLAVHPSIEFDM